MRPWLAPAIAAAGALLAAYNAYELWGDHGFGLVIGMYWWTIALGSEISRRDDKAVNFSKAPNRKAGVPV